jgi:hypothetical protein
MEGAQKDKRVANEDVYLVSRCGGETTERIKKIESAMG